MLTKFLNNKETFKKVNSISKYPSILTYHKIGKRGCLQEELTFPEMKGLHCKGYFSEKIDGTNTRIIAYRGDYIIGSREDLLYAKGDRIISQLNEICPFVHPIAEIIANKLSTFKDKIFFIYGETYGGKITKGSNNYIQTREEYGFRIFDIIEFNISEFEQLITEKSASELSVWREQLNQPFVCNEKLIDYTNIMGVKLTEPLGEIELSELPTSLKETYNFITPHIITKVGIDGVQGKSEGIVLRTEDRKHIVKIRFEDYERTFRYTESQNKK